MVHVYVNTWTTVLVFGIVVTKRLRVALFCPLFFKVLYVFCIYMSAICSQLCQSNSSSTPTWALNSDFRVRGKYSGPPRPLLAPQNRRPIKSHLQVLIPRGTPSCSYPMVGFHFSLLAKLLATPALAHLLPPAEHLPATPPTKKLLDTAR